MTRRLPAPVGPHPRVGLFALAGTPDPAALARGEAFLRAAGAEVVRAGNAELRRRYLAGTDEERLAGLRELLDAHVDVLLAARGGYGVMRLLDRLPWADLAQWAGWIVGFSDITALHAAAATRFPRATLLGPMGTTVARDPEGAARMLEWLRGDARRTLFDLAPGDVVRPGRATGVAVGGNLTMLAALVGTPFEPDYTDAVLFLEDVGEPGYRLDRLLTQLRLSSRLARVNAIVAGRLERCGEGEEDLRQHWRALLADAAPARAVIVEDLPFGHGATHAPIPLGVAVTVDTERGEVSWEGG